METNLENQFTNDLAPAPVRPQFLKIICILSFIGCGLMILAYLLGTMLLGVNEENANEILEKMQSGGNAVFNTDNPYEAIKALGMMCLFGLICNIVSLVGVIMMWNLNKIGFFIYVAAEFGIYFFSSDINANANGGKSYGMHIFSIIIDLAFVVMYVVNLKYMKKSNAD